MSDDARRTAGAFVHLSGAGRGTPAQDRYRDGFRQYVLCWGSSARDRVVYVDPNPHVGAALREEWDGWANLDIIGSDAAGCPEGATERVFYWADEDAPLFLTFLPSREAVRRRFPNGTIRATEVPCEPLAAVVGRISDQSPITLLSMDIGSLSVDEICSVDWPLVRCDAVSVAHGGLRQEWQGAVDRALRSGGFHRAGRAWGDAGTSRLYRRHSSLLSMGRGAVSQARVAGGEAVVHVRDGILSPESRRAAAWRTRVALDPGYSPADVLDASYGRTLHQVPPVDVDGTLPVGYGIQRPSWSVSLAGEPDPMDLARDCVGRHGVWPISFSYPRRPLDIRESPSDLISPIIPGFPYSFDDEGEYLATYHDAYLGITHRKAGWDCFRHLEIMASGAVPLMLDADQIPGYSMVHYPKQGLRRARDRVLATGGPPDAATRHEFRAFFERHLTSEAMARYLLHAAGLDASSRVLFVDERLPLTGDYQSVMTLIGLKQVLGQGCVALHPVDYVYADSGYPSATLYGRGFGYTRVLPAAARTLSGRVADSQDPPALDEFDAIVVGSVSRNTGLADDLLRRFPAARTIWIHGEDSPPTMAETRRLRQSGAHVFVRSIHTPTQSVSSPRPRR